MELLVFSPLCIKGIFMKIAWLRKHPKSFGVLHPVTVRVDNGDIAPTVSMTQSFPIYIAPVCRYVQLILFAETGMVASTSGGSALGTGCRFPFEHNGEQHDQCVYENSTEKYLCYTDKNYIHFGYCNVG